MPMVSFILKFKAFEDLKVCLLYFVLFIKLGLYP